MALALAGVSGRARVWRARMVVAVLLGEGDGGVVADIWE